MWPTLRQACNKDQWAAWPAILRHDAGGHRKGSRECSPAEHRLDNLLVVPLANGGTVSNPQTIAASVSSNLPCTVLAVTTESLDCLIADAQYQQHPYGKVWQQFDPATFSELVGDIDRRGLDQGIVLYHGMILEGWHRYLACLLTKKQPTFTEFQGTDLEAAERVHASGVRRQSTAEQRYASFLLLEKACPEFKEKYERLRQRGIQQQQGGTPLSTDGQRVDVVGAKAAAVGVSRSTAAKVEKVKKDKPEVVADIAAGKTTANKELAKITREARDEPAIIESEPSRLVKELAQLTQECAAIVEEMDGLDWSLEDEAAWGKCVECLKKAVEIVVSTAQNGFKDARTKADSGPPVICPTKANPKKKAIQEVLSIRKLKSLYGDHAAEVLQDHLDELPRKDGAMRHYKAIKPLPTQEEFTQLKMERYTSTASDLLDTAFNTLEDLAGECSDWYDNLPQSFQDGEKGSILEEARSTLENLSRPDCGEEIGALEVYCPPHHDCSSRASRRDDAVAQLQAVVDALEAGNDQSKVDKDEADSLLGELGNAISEAESVEFPGMYG